MSTVPSFLHDVVAAGPALAVGVCLLAVPLIVLLSRRPNLREAVSLTASVLAFALVGLLTLRHQAGEEIRCTIFRVTEDLTIAFRVDDLGLLFALVASGLWIANTLYSIGYMRAHDAPKQTRFYACFASSIAAALGTAFSSNLFSMFAFYEVLTLVTYPLVLHDETPAARAGARRYLAYLLGLSLLFQLPAIFLVKVAGGTLAFEAGGLLHASTASAGTLGLIFVLFLLGIGKAALMPFHGWLPAAMVAPTPVSALLHAVAVVKTGVFAVTRVVLNVFGVDLLHRLGLHEILVVAASFTVVTASVIALAQDNLKRRLAYSTVSQLGTILLGVALLQDDAVVGGLVHIGMHAAAKITLFFCAGAILVATHKTKVSELDGIGRRMPITMAAFTIGTLSMIGLPPAGGLVSKWYLFAGAAEEGRGGVLFVFAASTLLNAAYFLPIVWRAWRRSSPGEPRGVSEAPWPCVAALGATALLTVGLFFFPDTLLDLAHGVVAVARGAP